MKAAPFEYTRVHTLAELCAQLDAPDRDVRLVAGGQTLVPMMAMRLVCPDLLIDINDVPGLDAVVVEAGDVVIGATVRQASLEAATQATAGVPLLPAALRHVGHPPTRARGTIGGSLAAADPAAELVLVSQVLKARMQVRSARGDREVPAHEFFLGPLETALESDEVLVGVRFGLPAAPGVGAGFEELAVRHGDFAIVAAAVQLELDPDGRCLAAACGLNNVAASAVLGDPDGLVGRHLSATDLADYAAATAVDLDPPDDQQASARYRTRLARALLERALQTAHAEALQVAARAERP